MDADAEQQQRTRQEFLAQIAACVQTWNSIEVLLSWMLINLLESQNYKAVFAVFYSATTFEHKLKLVNNVAEYAMEKRLLQQWKTLRDRMHRLSKNRNKIVHYQMYFAPLDGSMTEFEPRISDPTHNTVAHLRNERPEFGIKDLLEKNKDFNAILMDLDDFLQEVTLHSSTPWPTGAAKSRD